MTTNGQDVRLQAALTYANRGWPVIPLHSIEASGHCTCGNIGCSRPGKHPRTKHGLKEATIDPAKIAEWWTCWPKANIGVVTGRASGLLVIDIDGEEGKQSLDDLERRFGKLPTTLESSTGRGRHLYFQYPAGISIRNSIGKLEKGLDVRGDGGYVVAPPSDHVSGAEYKWVLETELAPMPVWTTKILAQPRHEASGNNGTGGKISQGQRNGHLTSLAGVMRRSDMSVSAIEAALLEENNLRCDPPLRESEVRSIAQSIGRYGAALRPGDPLPVPGVLASEVTPKNVTWLWPNHIPFGKVTIFDGDPGLAKSTVSLDLVARISQGLPMPDGTEPGCPPSGAVLVSLEDDAGDTIRPRLEAAGAALEKVRIISCIKGPDGIERTPTLPVDLPYIEAAIKNVSAKVLVFDPFVAVLGPETNSYRDQDVRRVIAPIKELAEKTGVAVIFIRHLNKGSSQNPKYRGGGSIGIIGAARASFLFADKPGEEGRYVFAPNKGNLWRRKPPALEYSIEEQNEQPTISWHGASTHSAVSLLAQPERPEDSNALSDARNFLADSLKGGPKDADAVFREARRARVSERTLYRAKGALGILSQKVGIGEGQHWEWALPKSAEEPPKTANMENRATFDQAAETKPIASSPSPKIAKPENSVTFEAEGGELRGQPTEKDQPTLNLEPDRDILEI